MKQIVNAEVDHTHDNQPCTSSIMREHSQQWYDFMGGKCPACGQEANVTLEDVEIEVHETPFIRQKSDTDKAIS